MPAFYANIEPESLLIAAAILWGLAGLATGLPADRFPSEFPLLFFIISVVAGLVGITEYVPEFFDTLLTIIGVLLFTLTPIFITVKLYRSYPPPEKRDPDWNEPAEHNP